MQNSAREFTSDKGVVVAIAVAPGPDHHYTETVEELPKQRIYVSYTKIPIPSLRFDRISGIREKQERERGEVREGELAEAPKTSPASTG